VNLEQTTAILYALSVANNLVTPGKMEIRFWAPKWETIDFEDAETAVNSYYAEGGAYQATRQLIGPADVVPLAVAARNRRTRRPEILGPGCYEPDPAIRARLTATEDTPRALPSRFEPDITRGVRIEAGLAQCSDVLVAITQRLASAVEDNEPSESDQLRERALAVARGARRDHP
jgi:hypothetical protein